MSQKNSFLRKHFFIWVLANILGVGVLGALLYVFPFLMAVSGFVVSTFIISIPISFAQWIALRRILQNSIWWILSVPVGLLLAVLINKVIPGGLWEILNDESTAVLTFLYLVMGFTIGLPQWLILRRQFSSSSIWLLGSSMGVAAGFGFVLATDLINQSEIISYIVVVLVYATITGLTLSWLLAQHNQSQMNMGAAA
jgi:hypothetical protein